MKTVEAVSQFDDLYPMLCFFVLLTFNGYCHENYAVTKKKKTFKHQNRKEINIKDLKRHNREIQ